METTNTSRAERVQANLNFTCQAIKYNKTQPIETSLAIISQCQIDISYTLALILDEMQTEEQAIPLAKVKQVREKFDEMSKYTSVTGVTHLRQLNRDDVLETLDKLIAESEEAK